MDALKFNLIGDALSMETLEAVKRHVYTIIGVTPEILEMIAPKQPPAELAMFLRDGMTEVDATCELVCGPEDQTDPRDERRGLWEFNDEADLVKLRAAMPGKAGLEPSVEHEAPMAASREDTDYGISISFEPVRWRTAPLPGAFGR